MKKLIFNRSILSWALRLISAVILLQTLFFKFTGASESIYIFQTLGIEPWGRYLTGVIELIASVCILINPLSWFGSVLSLGTMSGAIMGHFTKLGIEVQGDGGLLFCLALGVFLASLGNLYLERKSILFLGSMLSACANPASAVKPEAERFKAEHPNQIQIFKGKTRTLQYAWSGDPAKPAILFVHGSPGSWEGWVHFLLDSDLQNKFHLISIDRPGYGGSGLGMTEVSLQKQAEEIFEILQLNQSAQPAILIGHSFGGPLIAKIAMLHPEKIGGLVFVASSVSPDLEETKWIQYPAAWWPIRLLIPTPLRVCNEEIFPLKAELIKMLPDWKKITAQSVLIQGEQDALVPPGNQDFLIEHLSKNTILKVLRIPGLNHFIPWKRPDLIFDAIQILNQKKRSSDVN